MALILLNLTDGQGISDLDILEGDEGFCRVLRGSVGFGKSRRERRGLSKRLRKEQERSVPSPSSASRYLSHFYDLAQEKIRKAGTFFIPVPNECLRAMMQVNGDFAGSVQRRASQEIATLDLDATLVETNKREAPYCYKGHKAYQPLNVY